MEFSGTVEFEDTSIEAVWLALSDPVLIQEAVPGCTFLLHVDDEDVDFDALSRRAEDETAELSGDPVTIAERAFRTGETYAALMQVSVGPVNPSFETVVTITERENGRRMSAVGEGTSGGSSFEMESSMELSERDDAVDIAWQTEADVFGRVANMGQRVINPVANRLVNRFFSSMQDRIQDLAIEEIEDIDDPEERKMVEQVLGRAETNEIE